MLARPFFDVCREIFYEHSNIVFGDGRTKFYNEVNVVLIKTLNNYRGYEVNYCDMKNIGDYIQLPAHGFSHSVPASWPLLFNHRGKN